MRSEHNAEDAFTKVEKFIALESILSDGKIDHLVEEWVLRLGVGRSRDSEDGECSSFFKILYLSCVVSSVPGAIRCTGAHTYSCVLIPT